MPQNLFTYSNVIVGNGEKGTEPIENRRENMCDGSRDYNEFPIFTWRIVGAGSVIQIDFDRNTNIGNDIGNKNVWCVVVNYISQDQHTLLLFIGYGKSIINKDSQYL